MKNYGAGRGIRIIFYSYKKGLGGLHDSYFTFSYVSPYVSRSFDQFCFLYSCSGFSKEDFLMVTELSHFNLNVAFLDFDLQVISIFF